MQFQRNNKIIFAIFGSQIKTKNLHNNRPICVVPMCQCGLRNEFNFWSVHRIMNTSGLLQS